MELVFYGGVKFTGMYVMALCANEPIDSPNLLQLDELWK